MAVDQRVNPCTAGGQAVGQTDWSDGAERKPKKRRQEMRRDARCVHSHFFRFYFSTGILMELPHSVQDPS